MPSYHYRPKQISEVTPSDSRISIIGKVIVANENLIILDDGTGKIEISADISIERNKLVRVFCSVVDEKLKADIIQDVEGLDLELLKKLNSLYNSLGV